MSFNVFFAWQMDTATKLNRWFIETAVKSAIRKLRAEGRQQIEEELKLESSLKVEPDEPDETNPESDPADADLIYQWGAHGHIGASMIAETILQRIEACGVFIADLTFTANVKTADDREKQVPNANVLIEVGAASRTGSGWDRIILVMNTAFGPVEELPFDLRHRQCQVKYTLDRWDDPDRPKKAKTLAEDIAAQLRPMYRVAMKKLVEQRRSAQEAQGSQEAQQEARARQVRADFEAKVERGEFHGFKHERGLLVMSILPATPLENPLRFDRNFLGRHIDQLRPMETDHPTFDTDVHSIMSLKPHGEHESVQAITELTDRGLIFSAVHWKTEQEGLGWGDEVTPFYMNRIEPLILKTIFRYLGQLTEMGVQGPWHVGFSLLRAKGFRLLPSDRTPEEHLKRPCRQDAVVPDATKVPHKFDTGEDQGFVKLFRHSLNQFWQGFGWPDARFFDEDTGKYRGVF